MKRLALQIFFSFISMFMFFPLSGQEIPYTWKPSYLPQSAIHSQVPVPAGFFRTTYPAHTFSHWLRSLPVDTTDSVVHLFNGERKRNQQAHAYILDIPVGSRDLQQCADAVMRLKAEYQFSQNMQEAIHFTFTNGEQATYTSWEAGYRPKISGNRISWQKTAKPDGSYKNFLRYMNIVFSYAGTWSFSQECSPIPLSEAKIGDIFIQGGFPGHAVIIVDEAVNVRGEKIFLLAQSYMPAQQIHILKNPQTPSLSPWYSFQEATLTTPEWSFPEESLKRIQW
ncbi:MAG: DUF4846 domain-containing protein [Bacteroidota bacterium]